MLPAGTGVEISLHKININITGEKSRDNTSKGHSRYGVSYAGLSFTSAVLPCPVCNTIPVSIAIPIDST